MNENKKPDLSALLKEMPPYVARNHPRFKELTGYSGRTFANLDCLGQTNSIKKILLGNTVAYERESLVAWLESRSKVLSLGCRSSKPNVKRIVDKTSSETIVLRL